MTLDQARAQLEAFYNSQGIPKSIPFVGNIHDRITAGLVQMCRTLGKAQFLTMIASVELAVEVLAGAQ